VRRRIFSRPEDLEPDCGPCPPLVGSYAEKYGISREEVRAFESAHGVKGVTSMFDRQRRGAWERGIAWEISLREWLAVWGAKIGQRGQGRDKLMMCRRDDKGPYRADNVRLATAHENATDAHVGRRVAAWTGRNKHQSGGY
jgi:hypothetical protein